MYLFLEEEKNARVLVMSVCVSECMYVSVCSASEYSC